jgi:hypothetical protein
MSKTLDSILATPPLTKLPGVPRHSPGAQEAIDQVAALAAQQAADLPASASPFEALPEPHSGIAFSFTLNPRDRTFDFCSPHALRTEIREMEGQIKGTIHF